MKISLAPIIILLTKIAEQSSQVLTRDYEGQGRSPTIGELKAAFNKARDLNILKNEIRSLGREDDKRKSGRFKCPLSLHHGTRQYGNTTVGKNANIAFLALRILLNENGFSHTDLQNRSLRENLRSINGVLCQVPKPGKCNFQSRYRNVDGSCNNRENPDWGMAGSIQQRVRANDYDDKISLPRTKGLPNARTVSDIVHRNPIQSEKLSKQLTLHVMGFGQFLDHDIARTPEQDVVEDCCKTSARTDIDNCFNIIIPKRIVEGTSDILKPGHCIEVKRSAPVLCPDDFSNGLPIRQQTTILTSFVDASNVYGSSETRLVELREHGTGYRLATDYFLDQERILSGPNNTCILQNSSKMCSAAGDERVNEVPTLTSYHFLFVKEHNRIADELKNYYSNNETIFQETRRIVIAIMQKIVYDEFLASIFSPSGLKNYQLLSSASYVYEPKTNPTMLNAFGIAFRVGHTWIPQAMRLFRRSLKEIYNPKFNRKTEDTFNKPDLTFEPFAFRRLAYYMSGSASPETDRIIEEAVRSRLFIDTDNDIAFDLAALNIQRGRDHGLPSYNEYRKWCNLSPVRNFWDYFGGNSGLVDHSFHLRKRLLFSGYKSPLDIDLFVGGLTETPVPGGEFGPTFECIIGRQFRRLKFGDRLWYQSKEAQFTKRQIAAIESYSLSRMLCNNYNFDMVHSPNVFLSRTNSFGISYPGSYNWFNHLQTNGKSTLTSCDSIPNFDIFLFNPKFEAKSLPEKQASNEQDVLQKANEMDERFDTKEELMHLIKDIVEKT